MTAVIGLLNKKGLVLAADSAVTRKRREGKTKKSTLNGNKMLRLSTDIPGMATSVMITGNALFLSHPWDILIRHYRRLRGKAEFKTLEENVADFFNFLSSDNNIWENGLDHIYIKNAIKIIFKDISAKISDDAKERNRKGQLLHPEQYETQLENYLIYEINKYSRKSKGISLENYLENDFIKYAEKDLEETLEKQKSSPYYKFDYCPPEVINKYKDDFLKLLFYHLSTIREADATELVFAGYGLEEPYPSLMAVRVCDGFDHRPVYFIDESHTVKISDTNPAAICRFAQTDVIDALLTGISGDWENNFKDNLKFMKWASCVDNLSGSQEIKGNQKGYGASDLEKLFENVLKDLANLKEKNEKAWLRDLKDYDPEDMAELALNLIDLTGFQRILTFQHEGVGGEVDRAILTKEEGFKWVHRKSWNHHQDIDGKYGPLGV